MTGGFARYYCTKWLSIWSWRMFLKKSWMLFLLLYQMVVHLELEDVPEEELDVGWPRVHDDVEDLLLLDFPAKVNF